MDIHARAMGEHATTTRTDATLASRVVELEAQVVALTKERDQLRASHARLREELELLKRRIFVAKAERVDTAQLEIEFAEKLRQLDALAGEPPDAPDDEGDDDDKKRKKRSTGRRDLKKLPLQEERIEIGMGYTTRVYRRHAGDPTAFRRRWQRGGDGSDLCGLSVLRLSTLRIIDCLAQSLQSRAMIASKRCGRLA